MTLMSGDKGISGPPDGDNLFRWMWTIQGPVGTVNEKMTYRLRLEFSSTYPPEGPDVRLETPCFYPNVDALEILKQKWTARLTCALCSSPSSHCWQSPMCPAH
ncbi:hypothetical protein HPB48_014519 [Haemaphysalis longicornis]|uniref:UBC core domain-containing protein n=1 Tax=Haemaphysalis longicornis TaxID=44386 RepID=A0A9J6H052_HAELO|nr:hypothetical protein HPB48_014519 [Haemaphysalis longicornis]